MKEVFCVPACQPSCQARGKRRSLAEWCDHGGRVQTKERNVPEVKFGMKETWRVLVEQEAFPQPMSMIGIIDHQCCMTRKQLDRLVG